jgi:elongation factor G
MCIETLHTRLAANAEAVQYPIGIESRFNGIIDLINRKAYTYSADKSEGPTEIASPKNISRRSKRCALNSWKPSRLLI